MSDDKSKSETPTQNKLVGPGLGLIIMGAAYLIWWLLFTVNCLHPGVIRTKLLRSASRSYGAPLLEGAKTLMFAAIAPDLENVSRKYYVNNRSEPSKDITYDKEIQKKLWKKTEEIVGMEFNKV